VDGLEGLTLGRLASDLSMSKSGLFAHFGSKEELQLATIEYARQIYLDEVIIPGPGLLSSEPSVQLRRRRVDVS
jgi:AcrR family transcriptional regulator